MLVLADNGAFVLAEDGNVLLFFRRRILPTWMVFVAGLLTVLVVANAVVQVVVGGPLAGAAVLLGLGVLFGIVLRALVRKRSAARAQPLEPREALLVIDLAQRQVRDAGGQVLSSLDAARAEKTMQATSSSRALTIVWPSGRAVVYRGDPFARNGSIDVPAAELKARGVPVAW
jgi:hypothetical protein